MKTNKKNIAILLFILAFGSFRATAQQVIITIAGNGTAGSIGDGAPATAAEIHSPTFAVKDDTGNLYIVERDGYRIRKVDTFGIIYTIAGTGVAGTGGYGDGGPATAARFQQPEELAFGPDHSIYIVDRGDGRVRKIDPTGIITTVLGSAGATYSGDGGPASAAGVSVNYIAIDPAGNMYITDNNRIRKVNTAGIISTIAGDGTPAFSGDGGQATAAELNDISSVDVDRSGNIYIGDGGNNRVRKIDNTGIITTVAGNGVSGSSGDGGPATAAPVLPTNVPPGNVGDFYISESNAARKVSADGIITTIAGNIGTAGYSGDGGPATAALLHGVYMTADKYGNVLVADTYNNRVREITSYNHLPVFSAVASSLSICENDAAISLDTLLRVTDVDMGQAESWRIITGPRHGTAAVSYTTTSTGSRLTPTGTTYTPSPGYTGLDTLVVQVDDTLSVGITTLYITVNNCSLGTPLNSAATIAALLLSPNPNVGSFSMTMRSPGNEQAQVVIKNIVGETVKEFTTTTNTPTNIVLDVANGIYFVNVTTGTGKWCEKVTVIR